MSETLPTQSIGKLDSIFYRDGEITPLGLCGLALVFQISVPFLILYALYEFIARPIRRHREKQKP